MSQQVNLYNPALLPKLDVFSARRVLATLGAIFVLALLLSGWTAWNASSLADQERQAELRLGQTRSDIAALSLQLAGRKPNPQLTAELASLEALLVGHSEVIEVLKSGSLGDTNGVSEYFKAFARQGLDGLWLTGFTVVGAGNDITIEGRALRAELVPTYLRKLRREDVLRGHEFALLSVQKPVEPLGVAGEAHKGAEFLEFRMSSRAPEPSLARPLEAAR